MQRRVERGERAARGGGVRRLRVVDVAHAVALADELEPVRDAGERAQRLGDRGVVDPGGTRRGRRRRGGVLAVVRARDERLGRAAGRRRELDARRRPARAEAARHDRGVRARWFSKMPQLGGAVGLEACRAGRGGRARGSAARRPRARSSWTSSSWKDDSSQTTQRARVGGRRAPVERRGRRCPATSTGRPAARKIAPSSSVVVVLPFVPVTPRSGVRRAGAKPSSTSLQTGIPRARAAADERRLAGHAGALDQQLDAVEQRLLRAEVHFDACASSPASSGRARSAATHLDAALPRAPRRRLAGARQADDDRALRFTMRGTARK